MEKRYSEMTEAELNHELLKLKEGAMKKHQAGFMSEAAVLEQKFYMAKSYLLDPSSFNPGEEYRVTGLDGNFKIHYLNGMMAWGSFDNTEEEIALPIARLEKIS